MIVHTDEEQPVRRAPSRPRRRACRGSSSAAIDLGRAPAAADLDQRADNRAHHVAQEAVAGDFIRQQAPSAIDAQCS